MEKILIIDDDPQVLESLEGVLAAEGYTVETATSGPEAIQKAQESDYALIITDVRMPGMDGIAALGKLSLYQPDARKLVITGYAEHDAPVRAIQVSVDDYLMKPFGADLLLQSIRTALSRYRLEKQKSEILRTVSRTVSSVFQRMVATAETLHPERKGFGERLAEICGRLADALDLGFVQTERLKRAAALHDIGFIPHPERHALEGAAILRDAREFGEIAFILENHHGHENPESTNTPIESKILATAEDYLSLLNKGLAPADACRDLGGRLPGQDADLLSALSRMAADSTPRANLKPYPHSSSDGYERLLRLAQAYTLANETDAASDVLKRVEQFPNPPHREDLQFRFILACARNLIRQRKFLEGYHQAEKALETALASNLGSLSVARTFLELSLAKLCSSNLEKVGEMLRKSDEVFEKNQDSHGRARALLYSALYAILSGERVKGNEHLESCLHQLSSDEIEEWLESESLAVAAFPGEEAIRFFSSRLPGTRENMRIHTLGPFRVYRKGKLIREEKWKSKKAKSILTFLLFNKQKPVLEERLCEIFWGDSDFDRSRKSLYQSIYLLRQILEPEDRAGEESACILSGRSSYQFNPSIPCWWDVEQATTHFQAAKEFSLSGESGKAAASYLKVEKLCEGDLLEDFPSETWCDLEREKLREMRQDSLLFLAREDEEQKRFPSALERINRVLVENPLHERAATQLVRVLFRSGQRSEAVRRYHAWRELLKRELNLEPPSELLAFYLEMTGSTGQVDKF